MSRRRSASGGTRRAASGLAQTRRLLALAEALQENALRAGETAIAASRTIARRHDLMAEAASDPWRFADPEFSRMVTEKIAATTEAGLASFARAQVPVAAIDRWLRTQGEIAMAAWTEASRLTLTPRSFGLWLTLTQRSVESSAVLAQAVAGVGAAVVRAGLDPFHRATTANARRLDRD
jgi:hypothetical protein